MWDMGGLILELVNLLGDLGDGVLKVAEEAEEAAGDVEDAAVLQPVQVVLRPQHVALPSDVSQLELEGSDGFLKKKTKWDSG